MIRTARLLLRQWRDADLPVFAGLFDHPDIAEGSTLREHALYRIAAPTRALR